MTKEEALQYHREPRPGKIEVVPTKPLSTQYDLSLAYSPGVAEPCREIAENPDEAYRYTSKGNLVAVITNGTAVLGLGNIGAQASKPVMEGKAVLFKRFAGVDVYDIEIDCDDPEELIRTIASLEPTFGGINLEDIKAPECFHIEKALKTRCKIPVMHDDQHGTAIITGAALLNALELVGKKIGEIRIVVVGAGAAGIACTEFFVVLGVDPSKITMFDKEGLVHVRNFSADQRRDDPRFQFASEREYSSIGEALAGADVFLGVSVAGVLSAKSLEQMGKDPVIFALANPDPEVDYETARSVRPDAILATGRSDYSNQINNVLCFPFLFRGALDVGAREINDAMKIAAAESLARLAREPVPEMVHRAYSTSEISFGREYLIPKPLDPRLLTAIAPAVAKAAIESGVARYDVADWDRYEADLLSRVGIGQKLVVEIINQARREPKRVVFLKAAEMVAEQGIALPILLGRRKAIAALTESHSIHGLENAPVIDPLEEPDLCARYGAILYQKRHRKGVTEGDSNRLMRDRNYFGAAMVEAGDADAVVSGRTKEYPKVILPALQLIGTAEEVRRVAGMYIVNTRRGTYFFADTTVNLDPGVEDLVDIIGLTAQAVRVFNIEPCVAVLSFSNFGTTRSPQADKCKEAVAMARKRYPELIIDGEVQANVALDPYLLRQNYPFSTLVGRSVNTLIFPNLESGNIAYKLMGELGGAELIGPVLMGMRKPVQILQLGASVREIVAIVALAVVEAQRK
jgi:malate dehydrogenase (oxaloacetate-decarboxylating)(NADP+)